MVIRPLEKGDDKRRFHSGDAELDRFLLKYAGQNQFKHYIGVTYVAAEGKTVLGYATVSPAQIDTDALPPSVAKRLPAYPLPVLRLARLAIDESLHGKGLGSALLRFVLTLALRMADEVGCVGVLVDAKLNAEAYYRRYGFMKLDGLAGISPARPQPIPMFLSIRQIRGAMARGK